MNGQPKTTPHGTKTSRDGYFRSPADWRDLIFSTGDVRAGTELRVYRHATGTLIFSNGPMYGDGERQEFNFGLSDVDRLQIALANTNGAPLLRA